MNEKFTFFRDRNICFLKHLPWYVVGEFLCFAVTKHSRNCKKKRLHLTFMKFRWPTQVKIKSDNSISLSIIQLPRASFVIKLFNNSSSSCLCQFSSSSKCSLRHFPSLMNFETVETIKKIRRSLIEVGDCSNLLISERVVVEENVVSCWW